MPIKLTMRTRSGWHIFWQQWQNPKYFPHMHLPKALASWRCRERLPKFPQCDHQHLQIRKPKLHTLLCNSFLRDMNTLQPKKPHHTPEWDRHDNSSLARLISGLPKGSAVQGMESWSQKSYSLKQWARFLSATDPSFETLFSRLRLGQSGRRLRCKQNP